ncbi:MAG: glutamate racemase [Patescibacteria group bacterium]
MKIGFFDSGLGGLFLLKKVIKVLPQYDYLFLADLRQSPYGNRSPQVIYDFTREAAEYLFKNDCQIIILACNTASALALRKLQQEYLSTSYPGRRLLGVVVPTIEEVLKYKIKRLGILATKATIESGVYIKEIRKLNSKIRVFQYSAPLLVSLIENNSLRWAEPILRAYLKPLVSKKVEAIILGCTHYAVLKKRVQKIVGPKIKVISQEEIIPQKLADYLARHPEIAGKLSKTGKIIFETTDLGADFCQIAKKWFGKNIDLKLVAY